MLDKLRRWAAHNPVIVRTTVAWLVSLAAYLAADRLGVEIDSEATVVWLLGTLGLSTAAARDGVDAPDTVAAKVDAAAARAADEALLAAPTGRATVVQVGADSVHVDVDPIAPPPPKPPAGLMAERWDADIPTRP